MPRADGRPPISIGEAQPGYLPYSNCLGHYRVRRQSKTPLEGEEIPVEGSIVPITFSEIRRIPAIEICIQESTTDENDRVKREMIESDLHFLNEVPLKSSIQSPMNLDALKKSPFAQF